jgi:hypothetical protein
VAASSLPAINSVAAHACIYWPAAVFMPENGPFLPVFDAFEHSAGHQTTA